MSELESVQAEVTETPTLAEKIEEIAEKVSEKAVDVLDAAAAKKDELLEAAEAKKDELLDAAAAKKDELLEAAEAKKDELLEVAVAKKDELAEKLSDAKLDAHQAIDEKVTELKEVGQEKLDKLAEIVAEKKADLVEAISDTKDDLAVSASTQKDIAVAVTAEKAGEIVDAVTAKKDEIVDAATEKADEIVETVTAKKDEIVDAATEKVDEIVETVTAKKDEIVEKVTDVVAAAKGKVADVAGDLKAKAEDNEFLAELEKTFVKIRRGQVIKGAVVQVTEDEVCVNIGYKSDGIITKDDLTADGNANPLEMFKIGDEIEAEVVTLNDGEGNVKLTRKKIEGSLKWRELVDGLDMDAFYPVKVTKVIKGGVLTKLEGYDAFIPASQLSLKYIEDLTGFIDQTLETKIIDVDKRQKRFVLSCRDKLLADKAAAERTMFDKFEKNSVITGKVKRLTDFGAFVDIGGVDGLLHVTDISWVRIKHPSDVLKEGDEVQVKIMGVDPDKKKISLGYKQLMPRPWELAPEKYLVGDTVQGKVVRIAPFGAFVELEPSIDGLVHISQVANKRIEKVEDVLKLGDLITAKVLEVDPDKKRISLSIRALLAEPEVKDDEVRPERRERREKSEEDSYVIPKVEEATTSLADIFSKFTDGE